MLVFFVYGLCYLIKFKGAAVLLESFTGISFNMGLAIITVVIIFYVIVGGLRSVAQGWWFDNMTALFLACAILLAFTSGIGEKNFMDQFIGGAADLMGVALVVGVARGINIILEDGMISDTILEFFSGAISGMNPIVFIILMMLVFIVLGFFISSSSVLCSSSGQDTYNGKENADSRYR